jgi:hypothetical protein
MTAIGAPVTRWAHHESAVAVDSFWGVQAPQNCPPLKIHQRLLKRDCGPNWRLNV